MTEIVRIEDIAKKRAELAAQKEESASHKELLDHDELYVRWEASRKSESEISKELTPMIAEFKDQALLKRKHDPEAEVPGGKFINKTSYEIDPDVDLVKWAIENNHLQLLQIDQKLFKDVCKSPLRPDFVKEVKIPAYNLNGDLSEFLPEPTCNLCGKKLESADHPCPDESCANNIPF